MKFSLINCTICNIEIKRYSSELKRCQSWGYKPYCKNCKPPLKRTKVICLNCGIEFIKKNCALKQFKNSFCSKSCSATYHNTHKTTGIRRSKLETWLEQQLTSLYPNYEIHFNKKDAINSELDIYFPQLKLAFELNGVFHYEPIYGAEKLASIQNNDQRKFAACIEKGISLCIIDSSKFGHFKIDKANEFLSIISNIINKTV